MGLYENNRIIILAAASGIFLNAGIYSENNYLYRPYGERNTATREGVTFGRTLAKEEMKESVLLGNLDKEGRALYFSLNDEGKKIARQLSAEARENRYIVDV